MVYKVNLPLAQKDILKFRSGDELFLSGVIYTARDAAHQKIQKLLRENQPLPFPLEKQVIYYAGPTPAPAGKPIGSIGPTTSDRMDPFTPELLARGVAAVIGKGPRAPEVKAALRQNQALYLGAIGGAGALLARSVSAAEIIAFSELGTEAVRRLTVKDFPVTVIYDTYGGDLYWHA
ncbi:MAG: FumA C-terminus/TtdB family hydratase beta subunit [Candidatus Margulisbacteria bacterium]|jgi:fumarate hydratase subunit beta|nr:FumA C-terminus/TtdB family hydratase beta subunit [Candidatus Margulisiibacteriota bacterium]